MKKSYSTLLLFPLTLLSINPLYSATRLSDRSKSYEQTNNVGNHATVYSKGCEHDDRTGLLTLRGIQQHEQLVRSAMAGDQQSLKAFTSAGDHNRRFVYTETLGAYHVPLTKIPPFPPLTSNEGAALLTEVYLQALLRDVMFDDYGTGKGSDKGSDGSSLSRKAFKVINAYEKAYKGPLNDDKKTDSQRLFRGNYYGAAIGPYISQFLYLPIISFPAASLPTKLELVTIPADVFSREQLQPIAQKKDFAVSRSDYLALQNGLIPQPYSKNDFSLKKRLISNGRDLASYVHFDSPYHPMYHVMQILYAYKFNLADKRIKSIKKTQFQELQFLDILTLLNEVSNEAEKVVSAYKWQGQRILRPEEFAYLVDLAKRSGNNCHKLSSDLFGARGGIDFLAWVKRNNKKMGADSYLLPQAYPEGAPLHPSYPSGHATYSGAYVTILKSVFQDRAAFSSLHAPVKPNPQDRTQLVKLSHEGEECMTIGGELNKLASNLAFGRNFAGIHYRADADQGMRLGEAIALAFLETKVKSGYIKGFEFTNFDGKIIKK